MHKLVDGVHAFHAEYFATHRALFRRLAERGQHPETLFITCSDSRVVPNLITSTEPGDLFIIRNVGNVVPQVTMPGGTAAAIEYAVEVLGVTTIIVCGHTHCGAVNAILNPEQMDRLPFVKKWLAQGERVRQIVAERYAHLDEPARMLAAVEENVLVQIENLRAFPNVAERLERGVLQVSAWVFEIASGDVYEFDPNSGQFGPVGSASIPPAPPASPRPPPAVPPANGVPRT